MRIPQEVKDNLVHVFVYGTLKRGFPNHWLMEDIGASFVKKNRSSLRKYSLRNWGHIPFLSYAKHPDETPFKIAGEVYEVKYSDLGRLDLFESGYTRETIHLEDSTTAFVYIHQSQNPRANRILSDNGSDTVEWHVRRPE